jgi:hypothetical protein
VPRLPTLSRLACLACLLALPAAESCVFAAAAKTGERVPAAPELSAEDLNGVRALFARLGAAFLANDVTACMSLVATQSAARQQINTRLTKEFAQVRYVKFEAAGILPDDKFGATVHSVDVLLRCAFVRAGGPPDQKPIEFSNSYTFVVRKLDDGSFALYSSQFFDSLGQRQGLSVVAEGLLAIMALCVLLSFWVWMGYAVLRARPRSRFWRIIILLPPIGALAAWVYFFWVYLPNLFRDAGPGSQS